MYHALVHFPDIDTRLIDLIRRKHDSTADLLRPHITVLFPVPGALGEAALVSHIEKVLRSWKPFPIRLRGLHKSWDHYLFLTLEEGNEEVIRLYRALYTGMLAPHIGPHGFIPHLGLGLFVREPAGFDPLHPHQMELDAERFEAAWQEVTALGLDYRCLLDRLHMVQLEDDLSRLETIREFALGGTNTQDR